MVKTLAIMVGCGVHVLERRRQDNLIQVNLMAYLEHSEALLMVVLLLARSYGCSFTINTSENDRHLFIYLGDKGMRPAYPRVNWQLQTGSDGQCNR